MRKWDSLTSSLSDVLYKYSSYYDDTELLQTMLLLTLFEAKSVNKLLLSQKSYDLFLSLSFPTSNDLLTKLFKVFSLNQNEWEGY